MAHIINIYGQIGASWWEDESVTAASFIRDFKALEADDSDDTIEIHINSPGGSVNEGVAIYNTIAASKKNTITVIDGMAYSMGAIIAFAAKTVKAAKNSTILLHNVSGVAYGNANDFRGTLELIEALDDILADTIATKTGRTLEDIKATWFNFRDHTFTASKALAEKLVDEILDYKAENVPADLANMSYADVLAWWGKQAAPDNQKSFLKAMSDQLRNALNFTQQQSQALNNKVSDMKMKFLAQWAVLATLANVSFAQGETEKEVDITPENMASFNNELTRLTNELKTATEAKDLAVKERDEAKAEATKLGAKPADTPTATGNDKDPDLSTDTDTKNLSYQNSLAQAEKMLQ